MSGYAIVRRNIFSINGKIETAYNTRNAPSATTDAIGIQFTSATPPQLLIEALDFDGNVGDNANGTGPLDYIPPSGRSTQVPIGMYWRGYGAAYSAPHVPPNGLHVLLQASGLTPTGSFTSMAESYTYAITPDATTPVSLSLDCNDGQIDGTSNYRLYQSLGTLFNLKFDVTGAKPLMFTFDGKGTFPGNPTEAAFTTPTLSDTPGILGSSGLTLSLGGVTLQCLTAAFDLGRTFFPRNPLNPATAHLGWCAGGMKPILKVTVEKQTLANFDPWSLRQSMTKGSLIFGVNQTQQYNRLKLLGPYAQVTGVKDNTHGNIGTYDLDLLLTPSVQTATDFLTLVAD